MRKPTLIVLLTLLSVGLPSYAQNAPQPSKDQGASPAPGSGYLPTLTKSRGKGLTLMGEGGPETHVGLDAAIGYNSNPYSLSTGYSGDLILKLRPSLALSSKGSVLAVEIGLDGDIGALPDVFNNFANPNWLLFTGHAYGSAEINRGGMLSFFLRDDLSTSRQPAELFVADLANIRNDLNGGLTIRPGRGPLTIDLDGIATIENFPAAWKRAGNPIVAPETLDNFALYGHTRLAYRFGSNAAVYVDGRGGSYTLTTPALGAPALTLYPLWTELGVTGKLADRVTGTIGAGYSVPFIPVATGAYVQSSTTPVPVTGTAEINWTIEEAMSLVAGLQRDFMPIPGFFDVYTHVAYIKYIQDFAQKVTLMINPSVNWMQFGIIGRNLLPAPTATTSRWDLSLDAKIELTYHVREWFGAGIAEQSSVRWTTQLPPATTSTGAFGTYNLLFHRHEVLAVLSFKY